MATADARAQGAAAVTYVPNPLRSPTTSGGPLSCPDPAVTQLGARHAWEIACTTDYGQANPPRAAGAAFSMYRSHDFVHWLPDGFVFGPGHEPWWAQPSTTGYLDGRYWSPELHLIDGQWVVYFSARVRPQVLERLARRHVDPGTFVLGVAWGPTVHGPWHSRILHYTGQFNNVVGNGHELKGGTIDPTEVQDQLTGVRYLLWVKQANQIWIGRLSTDGLRLDKHVHLALGADRSLRWECTKGGSPCVIEGPSAYAEPDGTIKLLFSADSTWDGSYKVGVAASSDPDHTPFITDPEPILTTGRTFVGPGGESQPVAGPGGECYLFFHVQLRPSHESQARYLAMGVFHDDGPWPAVSDGHPKLNNAVAAHAGSLQVIDLTGGQ